MAAPSYRASTNAKTSTLTSSVNITKPTTSTGDILILFVVTYFTSTVATPSGWTSLGNGAWGDGSARYWIYWKTDGGSEPSPLTISTTSGTVYWSAVYMSYQDGSGIDVSGINADASSVSRTSMDAPSVTTTVADTLLVGLHGVFAIKTITPPSGFTNRQSLQNVDVGFTNTSADLAQAAAGASGTKTFSWTGSVSARHLAALVAIAPSAPAAPAFVPRIDMH